MSKARVILIMGTWVAILPYLGFPDFWRKILFTLSGLGLIYLSYLLYRQNKINSNHKKTFDNFSENHDFLSKIKEPEEESTSFNSEENI